MISQVANGGISGPSPQGSLEQGDERCPFLTLPAELLLFIFEHLTEINQLHRVGGVCKTFREIVGSVSLLKMYKHPCEKVVKEVLFPESVPHAGTQIEQFNKTWNEAPLYAMLQLKEGIRKVYLPEISLERVSHLEGREPCDHLQILKFLDFRNSLVSHWMNVIQKTSIDNRFTIPKNVTFSDYSFQALLDALSNSPSVNGLNISSSLSYEQVKLMLDYTLRGKLSFEELILEPRRKPDLKTTLILFALIGGMKNLRRITLSNIDMDQGALLLFIVGLGRQRHLSHASIELNKIDAQYLPQFGEFIRDSKSLKFLALRKMNDSLFKTLHTAFLKCRIPMISFRDGVLSNGVSEEISQMIRKNRSLMHLDLAHNYWIYDEGSKLIIKEARKRSDFSLAISDNLFYHR